MTADAIVSVGLILFPIFLGFIVMKVAGGGGKPPATVYVESPEQAHAYRERITKAYLSARDFGVKTVTSIIQICAVTVVLVIGLFDKSTAWDTTLIRTVGLSLVLLVESMLSGVFTTALTYFGHYFEAHSVARGFGIGHDKEQEKLWRDRSNTSYAFALLLGIMSGVAFLEGLILLVTFWFKITRASIV